MYFHLLTRRFAEGNYPNTLSQSRCAIIAFHAGLEAVLAFLNHFPLFAMMLRVKDPQRLPGGLSFSLVQESKGPYLVMKVSESHPVPFSQGLYWSRTILSPHQLSFINTGRCGQVLVSIIRSSTCLGRSSQVRKGTVFQQMLCLYCI